MIKKQKMKTLPLKTIYNMLFLLFIMIPILIVLLVSLLILNQQFKNQAMENIEQAQQTVIAELLSDISVMSMRLSHLIYTNNNEILAYAAGTDTAQWEIRYENAQKLAQTGNLALEPVKDIVSVGFYMKSGRETYIKNDIHRSEEEIKQTKWYQAALENPNRVFVGSYDTNSLNDLFTGGKKDMLVLVFALAPDVTTDRSQRIEMVTFYHSTAAAERIRKYNTNYLAGKNKLGIAQITDEEGQVIFSTQEETEQIPEGKYTCVRTPIEFNDTVWYIESYIKTSQLTADYWKNAVFILLAAVLILALAAYFSRYFLRSIVKPVEEISSGLRQVEEGNLEVHISPSGQFEIRTMIHQFNAMVRRLNALIEEYEDKVRSAKRSPKDYLAAMLKEEMTPEEVNTSFAEFFAERYAILGFFVYGYHGEEDGTKGTSRLTYSFERNPRFASRCLLYMERSDFFFIFYRITEEDYVSGIKKMVQDLQKAAKAEFGAGICALIGREAFGSGDFKNRIEDIRSKMCLRHLKGECAVIDVSEESSQWEKIISLSRGYERLAGALYIADEKNMVEEKERLFELFHNRGMGELYPLACAVVLAIGNRFSEDNSNFTEVFGKQYDYVEKFRHIEDVRSLKIWLTNYFAWIMDYSASKLKVSETDMVVRAKRYITAHYEETELTLGKVAEYVGLNEKYFTNRFTKEAGENFSSYLTGLRMQKARELLKTTSFKVYEIAEMTGYQNAEHFNRMFKKINGISPSQYRKTM